MVKQPTEFATLVDFTPKRASQVPLTQSLHILHLDTILKTLGSAFLSSAD